MTRREMADLFGYTEQNIYKWFKAAEEENPDIAFKNGKSTVSKVIDYTLEECLCALRQSSNYTPLLSRYLKEHYIARDTAYLYKEKRHTNLDRSARTFIKEYASRQPCVCATCAFIEARKRNLPGAKDKPYCNFYEVFLNKALPKRNIYKDRCPTFRKSDLEPFIFTDEGPVNINVFNEIDNKTLGFDNSEFTSKRKRNEPVYLLKDGTNYKEEDYKD